MTHLTTKEASIRTGIAEANIRQRIARGTILAYKKGRDWFIRSNEVERLRKEQLEILEKMKSKL